ncbi:MAG: 5-formyltetrahydrofolate cyclo-ligase [Alphaproteobacteria bacterium]|nr:5-formyltetrahydrofolate cyclo-ligase [Alphaproteobacteria bacterium]
MYTHMADISKNQLRANLLQIRDQYKKTQDLKASGQALLNNIISAKIIPPESIIGCYWPIKSEADVRPLLTFLYEQGYICALPIVQAPKKPLLFREWHPGNLLVSGIYNILTPDETAPLVIPTVLFVPILGFDQQGHRLGHGEGYYDRTLESLRTMHSVIAIGIAFDCQEVEVIPCHHYDQPMDYIITPTRVIEIKK